MNRLTIILKAIRDWPLIQPLLDLLSRERVVVLLLALIAYYGIPQIPNISPTLAANLGNLVFYGGGIILLGLSAESLIETKAALPTTLTGIGTALVTAASAPMTTTTTTTTVPPAPADLNLSAAAITPPGNVG